MNTPVLSSWLPRVIPGLIEGGIEGRIEGIVTPSIMHSPNSGLNRAQASRLPTKWESLHPSGSDTCPEWSSRANVAPSYVGDGQRQVMSFPYHVMREKSAFVCRSVMEKANLDEWWIVLDVKISSKIRAQSLHSQKVSHNSKTVQNQHPITQTSNRQCSIWPLSLRLLLPTSDFTYSHHLRLLFGRNRKQNVWIYKTSQQTQSIMIMGMIDHLSSQLFCVRLFFFQADGNLLCKINGDKPSPVCTSRSHTRRIVLHRS